MKNSRLFILVNALSLLSVGGIVVCIKSLGQPLEELFKPPVAGSYIEERLLTYIFQLLCSVPVVVCGFTWGLLRTREPRSKQTLFIFCSGLITGGYLLDEIFRIHVFLERSGVSKLMFVSLYPLAIIGYALFFKRELQATPYRLLFASITLFFIALAVDQSHLSGSVPSLLEGITKLFSEINIALYFWYICQQAVMRALASSPEKPDNA